MANSLLALPWQTSHSSLPSDLIQWSFSLFVGGSNIRSKLQQTTHGGKVSRSAFTSAQAVAHLPAV